MKTLDFKKQLIGLSVPDYYQILYFLINQLTYLLIIFGRSKVIESNLLSGSFFDTSNISIEINLSPE